MDPSTMALTNSPSPVSSDSLGHDHDLDPLSPHFEESLDDGAGGKRKSRRPPSTAERRATHNAVERARRESLNGRFMDLAGALPNMANVKRPSKSVIVAKSLEFVQGTQVREQYLLTQNDSLRSEINELRARLGMPAFSGPPATAPVASSANRNRKASSVSSGAGSLDSPLLSTPSSSLTSFDPVLPPAPPASFSFNTAYASAFPQVKDVGKTPTPSAQQQQQASSYNGRPAPPALDVNYLMALSMQQQQAAAQHQNMLHMQGMGPPTSYQAVAPWMMPHSGAPVAAGGDSTWLYH